MDRRGNASTFGQGWRARFVSLALSPDGSRVAVSLSMPSAEKIQVRDAATESLVRIADPGVRLLPHLAWAPDGKTLFYTAFKSARTEVRQVAAGTVVPPRTVLQSQVGGAAVWPQPAPDGRTLCFYRSLAGTQLGPEIARISLDEDPPRPVVVASGMRPVPSPDGRWLAYSLGATLMVRSTDPTRSETWQVATRVQSDPQWARDSRALYYVAGDSMRVATIAGGATFQVTARQTLFALGALEPIFDVAPDGRFIMVRRLPASASGLDLLLLDNWAGSGS